MQNELIMGLTVVLVFHVTTFMSLSSAIPTALVHGRSVTLKSIITSIITREVFSIW